MNFILITLMTCYYNASIPRDCSVGGSAYINSSKIIILEPSSKTCDIMVDGDYHYRSLESCKKIINLINKGK